MIELFYDCENSNDANYADGTTLYSCATNIPSAGLYLQAYASRLFHWLKNNHLKANPGKFNILLNTKKPEIVSID